MFCVTSKHRQREWICFKETESNTSLNSALHTSLLGNLTPQLDSPLDDLTYLFGTFLPGLSAWQFDTALHNLLFGSFLPNLPAQRLYSVFRSEALCPAFQIGLPT